MNDRFRRFCHAVCRWPLQRGGGAHARLRRSPQWRNRCGRQDGPSAFPFKAHRFLQAHRMHLRDFPAVFCSLTRACRTLDHSCVLRGLPLSAGVRVRAGPPGPNGAEDSVADQVEEIEGRAQGGLQGSLI